jgi:hypothetical protein
MQFGKEEKPLDKDTKKSIRENVTSALIDLVIGIILLLIDRLF